MAIVRFPRTTGGRCLAIGASSTSDPWYLTAQNLACYPDLKCAIGGGPANGTYLAATTWDTTITALGSSLVLHTTWSPYVTTIASGSIPYSGLYLSHSLYIDVDAAATAGLFTTSFTVDIATTVSNMPTCTSTTAYGGWTNGWSAGPVTGIGATYRYTVRVDGRIS